MDQPHHLAPGSWISERYEIVDLLGEGGFATVYRARQLHVEREVAVKVLEQNDRLTPQGEHRFRDRFAREAQAIARIDHPNVVTVFDFGVTGRRQQPYMVLELLDGHDLEDELGKHGPLDWNRAQRLFEGALRGLAAAHREGIVHRDLKPSNLFIKNPGTEDERLVVVDFGIAGTGEADADGKRLTQTGMLMGTPQFMAPEFILAQETTPALDVYQMGLIVVEALTGEPACDVNEPYAALNKHCNGALDIPDWLRESALGGVLQRALAVEVVDRYDDAQAFHDALAALPDDALRKSDEGWTVPPTSTREPGHDDAHMGLPRETEAIGVTPMRKRWVAIGAVVALLLGIGLALVLIEVSGDGENDTADSGPSAAEAPEPDESEALAAAPSPPATATDTSDATAVAAEATPFLVSVPVTTAPAGATIERDGDVLGTTPTELELEAGTTVALVLELPGHARETIDLEVTRGASVSKALTALPPELEPPVETVTEADGDASRDDDDPAAEAAEADAAARRAARRERRAARRAERERDETPKITRTSPTDTDDDEGRHKGTLVLP